MRTLFGRDAKCDPSTTLADPSAVTRPPPAVTPTVTTVTAVEIPKKGIILTWDELLPPAAGGQHRSSSEYDFCGSDDTPRNFCRHV